jgi:non-heme chloroperoxidase
VPHAAALRLLEGRWRGTPVSERLDVDAAMQTFRAAQSRSMWELLSSLQPPLLVVRSGNSVLVTDAERDRYRQLFPGAELVDFDDSPHDIFRPDRQRYPRLVHDHVERVDRSPGPIADQ